MQKWEGHRLTITRERQRRERERKERESEIERALASADVLKFELLSNDLVWFGT